MQCSCPANDGPSPFPLPPLPPACRLAMPFFFEPNLDANINMKLPRALLPAGSTTSGQEDYYPFGAFMLNKLSIYVEWSHLRQSLPEWMKRKYLLRYDAPEACWAVENGITVDMDDDRRRQEEERKLRKKI